MRSSSAVPLHRTPDSHLLRAARHPGDAVFLREEAAPVGGFERDRPGAQDHHALQEDPGHRVEGSLENVADRVGVCYGARRFF